MNNRILKSLDEHLHTMEQLKHLVPTMAAAAQRMLATLKKNGKILWMGNGGSAADAQHLAAELVGRFKLDRRAIPSIALTTDTSVLTAVSNDHGYSLIFSRQLEALCQPNDIVVGISTSGKSKNILEGIKTAKQKGAFTIGLTGQGGQQLAELADLCLAVPSTTVARIQEGHIFIGHMLCELVENAVYASENASAGEFI